MAITRIDPPGTLDVATDSTSWSFTRPAAAQVGDVLRLQVTTTSLTSTTITPPSGSVLVLASQVGTTDAVQSAEWVYVLPSPLPANIVVGLAAARQGTVAWALYRGVDTTTPVDAAAVGTSQSATSSTTAALPALTTVTNGAMVVGGLCHGSSSTAITSIPSPWAVIADGTRRNGYLTEWGIQATAGVVAGSSWTVAASQQNRVYAYALRPASSGPATPALVHNLTRPATPTSFYVSTKTTDATSVRVKAGTNSAVTTGVVFGSAGTPDAAGWSRSTVTGLSPYTKYYYAVEMTDTASGVTTTAKVGEAFTLPTPGVPCASWVIALGSCHDLGNQGGTSTAYTNAMTKNPHMFWSLGDTPYADLLSTDQNAHRTVMETQLSGVSGWKSMNALVPTHYGKSDHDSSDNDSGTGAWTAPNRAAHLQMFPQDDRPNSSGLYRAEVVGRVRIIYLDTRYFCTSLTKLGATQLAWLKAQFLEPEPVKILVQDGTWIDNRTPDPVDDIWPFYPTERQEIADAPKVGQIIGAGGDQHAVAADDGSHNLWGGWPTVCAAPFRNNASHKTAAGPSDWSNGIWPTTEGAVVNQVGVITLTDTGSAITFAFRGYDGSNVARVSLDVVVPTPIVAGAADPVGVTDGAGGVLGRARSQADGVGATDAAAAALGRDRAQPDGVGASDVVGGVLGRARTQADPVGLTDSASASLAGAGGVLVADPVGISDAVSVTASRARSVADTVAAADVAAPGTVLVRALADTVAGSDAATGAVVEDVPISLGSVEFVRQFVGTSELVARYIGAVRIWP